MLDYYSNLVLRLLLFHNEKVGFAATTKIFFLIKNIYRLSQKLVKNISRTACIFLKNMMESLYEYASKNAF